MYQTILLILLLLSLRIHAQEDTVTLDVEHVIQLALENNLTLQAAKHRIDQVELRSLANQVWIEPTIGIEYKTDSIENNQNLTTLGFEFSQKLPLSSRIAQQKKVSELDLKLIHSELALLKRKLEHSIRMKHLELVYKGQTIKLSEEILKIYEQLEAFIRGAYQAGELPETDMHQIQLKVMDFIQTIENQSIEQTLLIAELQNLLGIKEIVRIKPTERIDILHHPAENNNISVSQIKKHPEYQIKELLIEKVRAEKSLTALQKWDPMEMKLFYENERENQNSHNFIGIGIELPMPWSKKNSYLVKEKNSLLLEVELSKQEWVNQQMNRLHSLHSKLNQKREQIKRYQSQVSSLINKGESLIADSYKKGQISLGELFLIQEQSLNTRFSYLENQYQYRECALNMDYYLGKSQKSNF